MQFELSERERIIDRFSSMDDAKQHAEDLGDERGLSIEWRAAFNHSAHGIATGEGDSTVFTIRKVAD